MRALIADSTPISFGQLTLTPVTAERWRAVHTGGAIVGHVSTRDEGVGTAFVAERWNPAAGRFRELGVFWSLRDAAACLRDGN